MVQRGKRRRSRRNLLKILKKKKFGLKPRRAGAELDSLHIPRSMCFEKKSIVSGCCSEKHPITLRCPGIQAFLSHCVFLRPGLLRKLGSEKTPGLEKGLPLRQAGKNSGGQVGGRRPEAREGRRAGRGAAW